MVQNMERCGRCGKRREADTISPFAKPSLSELSQRRAVTKNKLDHKLKFGRCDPMNIVVAAAACSIPAFGVGIGLFIVLAIFAVVLIVLW